VKTEVELQARMRNVEELLAQVERFPDERSRDVTRELVQALMDVHGSALSRMIELAADRADLLTAYAADPLIASLLLLYDLHPHDLSTRVRSALDLLRPTLQAAGATLELVSLSDHVARLALSGCDDFERASELVRAAEEALGAAAPELSRVEVTGQPQPSPQARQRVPLPLLGRVP
jgi:hypothetical protein